MGVFAKLFGGDVSSVGDLFSKVVGTFKLSPEKAAEIQQLKDSNAQKLAELDRELASKAQDALTAEVEQSASIIKAEANSQSWLPRNVRPLLLLLWGIAISINCFVPVVARFWIPGLQPFPLDPWVYKLTAIGFTGYVGFRSWEKMNGKDN